MSERRVLHFLWNGSTGGAERAVYQIVREEMRLGQWDMGVAFGCATGPYADAIRSLGCDVLDLKMRATTDLPRALRQVDRMRQFDIHHFHVLEPCQMLASIRCSQTTRVFTQRHGTHGPGEPLRKRARRSLGGALLRRHFHAVAGNTEFATRHVVQRYGLQNLPSQVTYNGIDFSLLRPTCSRAQARHRLGVGPDTMLVGSSGNFKGWKRFERLVDLLSGSRDVQVLLVGDGPCRPVYEATARSLGAADRLHITGLVNEVADYIQAMDVFVLPSTADESFGNSVVEAMALGIPAAVFRDSPGICEHMEDGATGFILDTQAELPALVAHLAADPELRTRIGEQGARHVRSKYTLERMHESYRRLYEAAAKRQ